MTILSAEGLQQANDQLAMVARLTQQRDDAVDELANMVDLARQVGQLGDFLKHALADRDYHRERGDEYADSVDELRCENDELKAEVAELKRELGWHTETTR
jgi:uncharacterized coiled-coil DUF342 family protein